MCVYLFVAGFLRPVLRWQRVAGFLQRGLPQVGHVQAPVRISSFRRVPRRGVGDSLTTKSIENKLRRYPQQHPTLPEPSWNPCGTLLKEPAGTLVEPWWNLTSGLPRTTPEPIWAETPKLSAVGEKYTSKDQNCIKQVEDCTLLVGQIISISGVELRGFLMWN